MMGKDAPTPARKSLHLFDVDETLLVTPARIQVRNAQGNCLRELSTAKFTDYRLAEGEIFDFAQFSDVGILSKGIVVKYTRQIIETIMQRGTRSRFGILTARPHKQGHAAFLIRLFQGLFGIRLRKDLIFTVSDSRFMRYKDKGGPFSALPVSDRKAAVVAEELIRRGYNDISFYDDSRENLERFRRLSQAFPGVRFRPHFIDPTWSNRLREFETGEAFRKALQRGLVSVNLILEHHLGEGKDCRSAVEKLQSGISLDLPGKSIRLTCEAGKYYLERT